MKIFLTTIVLISGLSINTLATSQTLSLNEYYSDYLASSNSKSNSTSYRINESLPDKLTLSEYYTEYCSGNDTPTSSQSGTKSSSTSKIEATNTCINHYAEYLN